MNTLGLVFIFLLVASIITTIILVYVFYIQPSSVAVVPTTSTMSTMSSTIAPLIQTSPIVKISPPPQPLQPPSKTSPIVQPKPPPLPPSQKNSSPSIPSSPGTLTADGEPADEVTRTGSALTEINTLRATLGKPPLKYYSEGTDCANKCAEHDNTKGFHDSMRNVSCPNIKKSSAQCVR
jgi:hypothetical protein